MSNLNHIVRKVLVLYTGGTIGMKKNINGAYIPSPNSFESKLRTMNEMNDGVMVEKYFGLNAPNLILSDVYKDYVVIYAIKEYDPLCDSSNMSSSDWIKIATDIEDNYEFYDGFVILHGTDTLVYTASALSFMLDGLQKPVVITGAQIPIYENHSDARSNLLCALIFAGCFDIPEVCVYFANKLMRGNRTTKSSCNLLEAFSSPNYHALAKFGIHIKMYDYHILKSNSENYFRVHKSLDPNVILILLFPTITGAMMESFINPSVKGVVLLSYGGGNIPSKNLALLNVLKRAVDDGVIIVNVSQCPKGSVLPSYECGWVLKEIGVLSGYDMTPAAAFTKLTVVLGLNNLTLTEKKQLMCTSICGELTTLD